MGWMVVLATGYPRLFCRVKIFCNNRVNLTMVRMTVWFYLEEFHLASFYVYFCWRVWSAP